MTTATATLTEQLREREARRKAAEQAQKADAGRQHREMLEKARTLDTYRELLARRVQPADGDADALESLMKVLGIDLAEIQADLEAAAEMERLRASLKTEEELAAGEAAKEAARGDAQAVEREMRAAIADVAQQVPSEWLENFMGNLELFLAQQIFGRFRLSTGRFQEWQARRSLANAAINEVRAAHREAERQIERLVAAHPRVFGGADEVVGGEGTR